MNAAHAADRARLSWPPPLTVHPAGQVVCPLHGIQISRWAGVRQDVRLGKVDADQRMARVVSLLEDSVRAELHVTNEVFELGLCDDTIERLTLGVTSGVLQSGGAWLALYAVLRG